MIDVLNSVGYWVLVAIAVGAYLWALFSSLMWWLPLSGHALYALDTEQYWTFLIPVAIWIGALLLAGLWELGVSVGERRGWLDPGRWRV